ncbi:MAG: S41 family peptidase [Alistipes sp.]|nr:S41 family peptidase [Candidatus Alistipes equi]
MNKKFGIFAVVLLTAVSSIFAVGNSFEIGKSIEIMISFMREIYMRYDDGVDPKEILRNGTLGMTSTLDPYTVFLPEEEMDDFKTFTTGKYGGIGAVIRKDGDYIRITEPYRNSPSDKAGIKIGDKIVSIEGESVKGWSVSDVSKKLRGDANTKVRVGVLSVIDSTVVEKNIRRERIAIPSISYVGYVEQGIGYIRHGDFTETCYDDMRAAIKTLESTGELKKLILDYRSNGGGVMQSAIKVLSLFLPKGTKVLVTKGRAEKQKEYCTEYEPVLPDIPMAVLINNSSASASEIVAGALQDLDRAVLLGQKSFGKGLVQTTSYLGYDNYAKITTAKYYIPSGRCIQAMKYSSDGKPVILPDSMQKEYTTSKGRRVYDGGGISPDIATAVDYLSSFTATLYVSGVFDSFGDLYYRKHVGETLDLSKFTITDEDFKEFKSMVKGKDIAYRSESRRALEQLRKSLKKENFNDAHQQIKDIEALIDDDTETLIEKYRKEIINTINSDIVLRYAYNQGAAQYSLPQDKTVIRARQLLNSPDEYASYLASDRVIGKTATSKK